MVGYQWWQRLKIPTEYHWWWKNDEIKNSIDPAKQSPSARAQIETALFEYIAAVPIVTTKAPVFPCSQVPSSLSSIYTSMKPSPTDAVNVFSTGAPVEIVTRRPIDKVKTLF